MIGENYWQNTYWIFMVKLFVAMFEQVKLRVAQLGVPLLVDFTICLPYKVVSLRSSVCWELTVKNNDTIFPHMSLYLILWTKELMVNLAGTGHIISGRYVATREFILISTINDHYVPSVMLAGKHIVLQKIRQLWKNYVNLKILRYLS